MSMSKAERRKWAKGPREEAARIAYEAHAQRLAGQEHPIRLPQWEDLRRDQRDAWRCGIDDEVQADAAA